MNKIINDHYPDIMIIVGIIFLVIGLSLICKPSNTEKIKQEYYLKGYEDCQKGLLPLPYEKEVEKEVEEKVEDIIKRNPNIRIEKFKG